MKFTTESVALILVTLTQVHVQGFDRQPAVSCPNECILLLCESRNPKMYAAKRYTSRCGSCWSTVMSSSSRYSSQTSMKMFVTSKCQRTCVVDLIEMSSGNIGLYRKDLSSCGACWSSIYHSAERTQLISIKKMKIIIEGLMKRFPVQDRYSGGSSDDEIVIDSSRDKKKKNDVLIEIDTDDKDRQQAMGDDEHGMGGFLGQGHGLGVARFEHESEDYHSIGGVNNNQGSAAFWNSGDHTGLHSQQHIIGGGGIHTAIGGGIAGLHAQSQHEHGVYTGHGSSSIYGIGGSSLGMHQNVNLGHGSIQASGHAIIGGIHSGTEHVTQVGGHIGIHGGIQAHIGHNEVQSHGIIGGIHQEEEHIVEHGIRGPNQNMIDHSQVEHEAEKEEHVEHQEEHEAHQEEHEVHQEEHVEHQEEHVEHQEEHEAHQEEHVEHQEEHVEHQEEHEAHQEEHEAHQEENEAHQEEHVEHQEEAAGVGVHAVHEQEFSHEERVTDNNVAQAEAVEEGRDESISAGDSVSGEKVNEGSKMIHESSFESHHKIEVGSQVNHSLSTQDVVCFCKIKNIPEPISATITNEVNFNHSLSFSGKWTNPFYSYEGPNFPFFKTEPFDYVHSTLIGKVKDFGSSLISELFKYKKALLKIFGRQLFSKLTGAIRKEVKLVLKGFGVLEPLKTCHSSNYNEYSYVLSGCIVRISRCMVDDIHDMLSDLLVAYSKLSPGSSFSGASSFITSFEKKIFSCGNKYFTSKIRGKDIKCGLVKQFGF